MTKLTLSKIFFFLIFIFSFPMISYERANNIGFRNLRIKPIETKRVVRVPQKVVIGMIQVESNGNDSAYNKSEEAVGCLQIRPIMVREVNRILKKQGKEHRFKMKDRWDRNKSLDMFWVWKDYHHPNSEDEVIARNWNGGPNGYVKKSTEKYWEKVSSCLEDK
jgi:hypothetical protein